MRKIRLRMILLLFLCALYLILASEKCGVTDCNEYVYTYLGIDVMGTTTAGPLLIFENSLGELCFVLTERNLSLQVSEEVVQKYKQVEADSNYVQLTTGAKYELKLIELDDVSYIKTRILATMQTEVEPNAYIDFSGEDKIYIIKNWKLTGKVYTCDQNYSDLVLKSTRVKESNRM